VMPECGSNACQVIFLCSKSRANHGDGESLFRAATESSALGQISLRLGVSRQLALAEASEDSRRPIPSR
jgi:hypothetical protein